MLLLTVAVVALLPKTLFQVSSSVILLMPFAWQRVAMVTLISCQPMLWAVTVRLLFRLIVRVPTLQILVLYRFTRRVFLFMATSSRSLPLCQSHFVMTVVSGFQRSLRMRRSCRVVNFRGVIFQKKIVITIWSAAIRPSVTLFPVMLPAVQPKSVQMQASA